MESLSLRNISTLGRGEFKGPEEIVGNLEVRSAGSNFVDKIFNAGNSIFAEGFFDDEVAGQGYSLVVNFAVTSLIDNISDGGSGGISEGDEGKNSLDKIKGSFINSNE